MKPESGIGRRNHASCSSPVSSDERRPMRDQLRASTTANATTHVASTTVESGASLRDSRDSRADTVNYARVVATVAPMRRA